MSYESESLTRLYNQRQRRFNEPHEHNYNHTAAGRFTFTGGDVLAHNHRMARLCRGLDHHYQHPSPILSGISSVSPSMMSPHYGSPGAAASDAIIVEAIAALPPPQAATAAEGQRVANAGNAVVRRGADGRHVDIVDLVNSRERLIFSGADTQKYMRGRMGYNEPPIINSRNVRQYPVADVQAYNTRMMRFREAY